VCDEDLRNLHFIGIVVEYDHNRNMLLLLQFYYGDMNLARDKFLQEQIKLDDGCIFFYIELQIFICCCYL